MCICFYFYSHLLKAHGAEVVEQVGDSPRHSHEREGGKEQVPERKGLAEVERLAVLHVLLSEVAEGHVPAHEGHGDGRVVAREVNSGHGVVVLLEGGVGILEEGEGLEELVKLLSAGVGVDSGHIFLFVASSGRKGCGEWEIQEEGGGVVVG